MGFTLLGASALLKAQRMQIEVFADGANKIKEKKAKDKLAKVNKAQVALNRFRGPEKMRAADWKDIISFVLPRYSSEAISKFQTIPHIKAKLEVIEKDKNKKWDVFMEEELTKVRVDLPVVEVPVEDLEDLCSDAEPDVLGGEAVA